jgi:hypothetical protein
VGKTYQSEFRIEVRVNAAKFAGSSRWRALAAALLTGNHWRGNQNIGQNVWARWDSDQVTGEGRYLNEQKKKKGKERENVGCSE